MLSESALKSRTSNPVVVECLDKGLDLVNENRPREAIECFNRAQDLEPEFAPAHYFEGVARMMQGQLQTGLRKLEFRFVTFPENQQHRFPVSPWRGQPIKGLRIVLHHEQGLGDSIQFARYIPVVRGAWR